MKQLFNNVWVLFCVPLVADVTQLYPNDFVMSAFIIAFTASIIGSTAYATNKNQQAILKFSNVVAIYSTGFFLSYLMFEIAIHYKSLTIAGVGSALVSYFSIDVILLISTVIKGLPGVILRILEGWGQK